MELNIKDISHLLMLPEKEVQQLIKKNEIPFQHLHDKVVFNKHQIIEWALGHNLPINVSGHQKLSEYHIETLGTLLDKDSFHYDCELTETGYLEQMISQINFEKMLIRKLLCSFLKAGNQ
ncbi:MAG: helix-turn-helix domain-containing protein [Ignavibacteriales bacterium]|nr:helix-turn-helix domain-containing protein [Ignavibacteriales bacterium]